MGKEETQMADLFFETINPANGKRLKSFEYHSDAEISLSLQKVEQAFFIWQYTSIDQRIIPIAKLADVLEQHKSTLAETLSLEMGKPLMQSEAEVQKCALLCRYYAEHGEQFLSIEEISTEAKKSFVAFSPLGVIFSIMPWNFPLWQVIRFSVPALLAGNTVLLKHAPNVPQTALLLEEIFLEAGFLPDCFVSIRASIKQIEKIFSHSAIQGVSFTGSTNAGKKIAALAAGNLKKTVLELGGSDPYIIFADAHLETAVESCIASRMVNSGQSCVAAKRLLVHESIEEKFIEAMSSALQKITWGDPFENKTLGPLARADLRDALDDQVQESMGLGAKLIEGGSKIKHDGFFYPPTFLTNMSAEMPAWKNETFGPVIALRSFKHEEQAIALANKSEYGLGAALFGSDIEHLTYLAKEKIMAGTVAINDFVKSNPKLPFGGIKNSGYGRELSIFGLREFVNIKSVVVQ